MKWNILVSLLFCFFVTTALTAQESRVALVIGNGSYASSPVASAKNDASSVAAVLQAMGFAVNTVTDSDQRGMISAIKEFGMQMGNADVGLFYYSGYAIQTGGKNYLIPVDTDILSEDDIVYLGIPLSDILDKMEHSGCKYTMLFLDACGANPWQQLLQGGEHGLAYTEVSNDKESIIMFSSALNKNSLPWNDTNSLFTSKFIEEFNSPGADIRVACGKITASVKKASGGNQIPWTNSSITSEFIISPKQEAAPSAAETVPAATQEVSSANEMDDDQKMIRQVLSLDTRTGPGDVLVEVKGNAHVRTNSESNSFFSEIKSREYRNIHDFKIAAQETSYALWHDVLSWALSLDRGERGYHFISEGTEANAAEGGTEPSYGEKNLPAVDMTWSDAVVWCNAYSEREGLEPVYYSSGSNEVLRDATQINDADDVVAHLNQNGYRLPLGKEWEYALRGGDPINENQWYFRIAYDDAGWFVDHSLSQPVVHHSGQKEGNGLGLFDMMGNVSELIYAGEKNKSASSVMGANVKSIELYTELMDHSSVAVTYSDRTCGFRVAQSSGDIASYGDPFVRKEIAISGAKRAICSVINPVLGIGSFAEGDAGGGLFVFTNELLGGTAIAGAWYVVQRWQSTAASAGYLSDDIDYTVPNIVAASGIGVAGIAVIYALARPAKWKKYKMVKVPVPQPAAGNVSFVLDAAPNGQLAAAVKICW